MIHDHMAHFFVIKGGSKIRFELAFTNSSFRKIPKKGSFPNEDTVFKLLYLRV